VEKREPYNFGDSIGFLALLAAVWAVVLTPPLWLKIVLLAASAVGCFVFLHKSHWTHAWTKLWRNASALALVVVLALIGIPQFRSQWESEHLRKVAETVPTPVVKPDEKTTAKTPLEPPKQVAPQPRETQPPLVPLMFKDSPLFTPERRERIAKDINGFAEYLKGLGIPIPADIPPIGVDTTNPKATGWSFNEQGNTKYYYNEFTLKQGILDNRQKVTEAFCYFVIGRFIYKAPPVLSPQLTREQWEAAIDTPEQMDPSYRHAASGTLTQYLNHSYWSKRLAENEKPVCPDKGDGMTYYFWRIREKYGKEFADKLAVFTIRATVDKSYADANQHFRQYFYERLKMADSVIDNENSKMPGIDAILRECEWLPK
jgi:hypothetical protein